MKILHLLLSLIGAAMCARASDFVVVPNDRATQSGNGFYDGGFSTIGDFQSVYGAKNFSGPVVITGVAFRQDEGSLGASIDVFIPTLTLRLSTYSGTFDLFKPTYSLNKGPDDTLVYNGSVSWHTVDLPTGSNPFDFSVTFSQPFLYDPSKGSLLMSYTAPIVGGSGIADLQDHEDKTIGWFSGGGFPPDAFNLVTRFSVTPIPEPAVPLMLITGVLALWAVTQISRTK